MLGNYCLRGTEFQFGKMEKFERRMTEITDSV